MPTKQNSNSLSYIETALFSFIWLIILLSPFSAQRNSEDIQWEEIKLHWVRMIPFVALSVFNHYYLVPYFLFRKKKGFYALGAGLTVIVFFLMMTLFITPVQRPAQPPGPREQGMRPPGPNRLDQPQGRRPAPPPNRDRAPGLVPPKINALIMALLIIGFDTGLRTVFRWTKTDKERLKLEKENINNQLAMLRNQVSPHFFMNTLNNIHALIDLNTQEAKDAVIRLSKLMRHLLYDSEEEYTPISKEIQFIESYIDLMKLRYSDKVDIQLNIPDQIPEKVIPPLLFTSLLENAFKHGISYSNRSFVHICITFSDNLLEFRIENSRVQRLTEKDQAGGIGIENTKRRLELIFQSNYDLSLEEKENEFMAKLAIPI